MKKVNSVRILLVEDEAIIALSTAHELERIGYSVGVAHTGKAAVEKLQGNSGYELVLMDVSLPGELDGPDAARAILSEREIPIVFLSSHVEQAIVERTRDVGSYGYVVKSSGLPVLDTTIHNALELFRAKRALSLQRETLRSVHEAREVILDNIPALISVCDVNERFLYANRKYMEFYGRTPDSIVGATVREVVGNDTYSEIGDYIRRALAGESVLSAQERVSPEGGRIRVNVSHVPRRNFDGAISGVYSLLIDVTELTRAEQELRDSREHLRATFNSIADGVISTDGEGNVTDLNPVAESLTGWTKEEALGLPLRQIFEVINSRTGRPAADPVRRAIAEGTVVGLANHSALISREGTRRQIADSASPIVSSDGTISGAVLVFRDVTDEYVAQERIRESEERLAALFLNMAEGVALHELVRDDEGNSINYRIVDCNPQFERILRLRREDAVGKTATDAYGVAAPPYLAEYAEVVRAGIPRRLSTYFEPLHAHFEISITPWGNEGFATIFTDSTEQHRAEVDRNRAIAERKAMLRELQHRVKNSFSLMRGLITIESASSSDPDANAAFDRLASRVLALSGLYEMLDESNYVGKIRLDVYLKRVVDSLIRGYLHQPSKIRIVQEYAPAWVETRSAGPVGLVVTELVTNAIKYAFDGRDSGTVRVATEETTEGIRFEISDDGIGLEASKSSDGSRTDGLQLVRALCRQLESELVRAPGSGTKFLFMVPAAEDDPV